MGNFERTTTPHLFVGSTSTTDNVSAGDANYRSKLSEIVSFLISGGIYLFRTFSKPLYKSAYLKIIFLISQLKHMLWVLKRRPVILNAQNKCFKLMSQNIITCLC